MARCTSRSKQSIAPVEVETPRDRDGSFEPETVRKRQTILAEGLSDKIISLYASGQSMQQISDFIEENYGSRLSKETISNITEKVWDEIKSWRNRSLDDVYPSSGWMPSITKYATTGLRRVACHL
jgi:transposase-like protein